MTDFNSTRFCGVFVHRGRLYVACELDNGGGRVMVLPPAELPVSVQPRLLGQAVRAALQSYRPAPERVTAEKFAELQDELLSLFGETSVGVI